MPGTKLCQDHGFPFPLAPGLSRTLAATFPKPQDTWWLLSSSLGTLQSFHTYLSSTTASHTDQGPDLAVTKGKISAIMILGWLIF